MNFWGAGIVILTLNGEFAVIVFPVVEADNLGMTAIMVMEQYFITDRITGKKRFVDGVLNIIVFLSNTVPLPENLIVLFIQQNDRLELLRVTDQHQKYVASIDAQGLIPKTRLYVHLSSDMDTARNVGSRHGKPVIYEVDCSSMISDGFIAAS